MPNEQLAHYQLQHLLVDVDAVFDVFFDSIAKVLKKIFN